jgi:hypothetical protein
MARATAAVAKPRSRGDEEDRSMRRVPTHDRGSSLDGYRDAATTAHTKIERITAEVHS